jgi:tetratricopeptide (TPR) repeat protein
MHYGKDFGSAFATTDFVGRLIVRVTWALLLVLPWMAAVRVLVGRTAPEPASALRGVVNLALILSVAAVVPAMYAQREIRKKSSQAETLLNTGRLREAWQVLDELSALGSRVPVGGAMPFDKVLLVRAAIDKIAEAVERPLPENASDVSRIGRASQWIALGQMQQAQEVLRPAAENNPQAALLLATVQEELREYALCIEACQHALALVQRANNQSSGNKLVDAESRSLQQNVYSRWSEVLRKMGQYRAAEDVLRDGLEKCHGSEAHFHFELASHYTMGGRPRDALAHYERAAEMDEQFAELSEAAIRELTLNTPICLLRPITSATR